jgi:hypothetical protein
MIAKTYKTLVIRPGETQVVKKNMKIFKTISNNVNVTSSCPGMVDQLNASEEGLVRYAMIIETVNRLATRNGADTLLGVGLAADFYSFSSPIDMNAFSLTVGTNAGAEKLFRSMQESLPSGSVLLREPDYQYENWNGPSGDSDQDNFWRAVIFFKSFPSIIEGLGLYVLYNNIPSMDNITVPAYTTRIYPTRIS